MMINVLLQEGSSLLVADEWNEECNLQIEELTVKVSVQHLLHFPGPSIYLLPHHCWVEIKMKWFS